MVIIKVLTATHSRVLGAKEGTLKYLSDQLSVFIKDAIFSPLYKDKKWDGRKRYFSQKTGVFPSGLLAEVEKLLRERGDAYRVESKLIPIVAPRSVSPEDLAGVRLYPYQTEAIQKAAEAGRGILWIATNGGKCLSPETEVYLYSGHKKKAIEVQAGDLLVGYDGTPRKVLSTCTGTSQMYRIQLRNGHDYFDCNEDHVLSLYNLLSKSVLDISVKDYFKLTRRRKTFLRLIRVAVDTPEMNLLPCSRESAYNQGYHRLSPVLGLERAPYKLRLSFVKGLFDGLKGRKLRLVGLPDRIAKIANIVRSVGLSASVAPCTIKGKAYSTLIWAYFETYKGAKPGEILQAIRFPGFEIIPLGEGPYAGFTLEGPDKRFVLGNNYLTHNTEIASGLIKAFSGLRTLFIVGNKKLFRQARERIAKRLDIPEARIGRIGEGIFDIRLITVAIVDSLNTKNPDRQKQVQALLANTQLLFVDEAHHARAQTWYSLCQACKAPYRFALSGTPFDDRADELALMATFGPVLVRITNEFLTSNGFSAKPLVHIHTIDEPVLDSDLSYPEAYEQGIIRNLYRNGQIVALTQAALAAGQKVLTLVRILAHGSVLMRMLQASKIVEGAYVHGKQPPFVIDREILKYSKSDTPRFLIASPIFREGVDVPEVQVLIVCDAGKSTKETLQKIGRGLRKKKTGENVVHVHDFADMTQKYLARHSLKRLKIYESENFTILAEAK